MQCPKCAGIIGGTVIGIAAGAVVSFAVPGKNLVGAYIGVAVGAAVSGMMAKRAGLWTGLAVGLVLGTIAPDLILHAMWIPIYARAQHAERMPPMPGFPVPTPNAELMKFLADTWLSSLLMLALGALAGAVAGYFSDRMRRESASRSNLSRGEL